MNKVARMFAGSGDKASQKKQNKDQYFKFFKQIYCVGVVAESTEREQTLIAVAEITGCDAGGETK